MTSIERREARFRARRTGIVRPDGVEPDAVMRVLTVPPELAGHRLDRFVQGQLRATKRHFCLEAHRAEFRSCIYRVPSQHHIGACVIVGLWATVG